MQHSKNNIILLSAGRRVKFMKLLQEELSIRIPGGRVIPADARPEWSAACRTAGEYIKLPYTTDGKYYEALPEACEKYGCSLVIPASDFDINALAILNESRALPDQTRAIISTHDFILKCQDKVLTCAIFSDANVDFLMPLRKEDFEFPLFMKPRYGYSSEDARVVHDLGDIPGYILDSEDYDDFIFQYYLDPALFEEYSIDCYYNTGSELMSAVPRKRILIRAGESSKAMTVRNEVYEWVMQFFNRLPGASGPVNIQCFLNMDNREIVAGEINPRFARGYTLSHAAGANHIGYCIEEYLGRGVVRPNPAWKENMVMLRYEEDVILQPR
jgi:carbamoyl-phosphate synthase large subunit